MRYKIGLFGLWLLIGLAYATHGNAVQATSLPLDYVQPNGDTLTIRLFGDERKSCRTTTDGYYIVQNKRGTFCYAKRTKDGAWKATCRQAHNTDKRSKAEQCFLKRNIGNRLTEIAEQTAQP